MSQRKIIFTTDDLFDRRDDTNDYRDDELCDDISTDGELKRCLENLPDLLVEE